MGVLREMLTSFWQLVYHSLTVGTQEKVPCIRHELQKTQCTRTKPADLQQIWNRSVLPKTDKLQTNLLSA